MGNECPVDVGDLGDGAVGECLKGDVADGGGFDRSGDDGKTAEVCGQRQSALLRDPPPTMRMR